jgi:hypothetical protein
MFSSQDESTKRDVLSDFSHPNTTKLDPIDRGNVTTFRMGGRQGS